MHLIRDQPGSRRGCRGTPAAIRRERPDPAPPDRGDGPSAAHRNKRVRTTRRARRPPRRGNPKGCFGVGRGGVPIRSSQWPQPSGVHGASPVDGPLPTVPRACGGAPRLGSWGDGVAGVTIDDQLKARNIAVQLLPTTGGVSEEEIAAAVERAMTLIALRTAERDQLVRDLQAAYTVSVGAAGALDGGGDHVDWLADRRADIKWPLWTRYMRYLHEANGFPPPVV